MCWLVWDPTTACRAHDLHWSLSVWTELQQHICWPPGWALLPDPEPSEFAMASFKPTGACCRHGRHGAPLLHTCAPHALTHLLAPWVGSSTSARRRLCAPVLGSAAWEALPGSGRPLEGPRLGRPPCRAPAGPSRVCQSSSWPLVRTAVQLVQDCDVNVPRQMRANRKVTPTVQQAPIASDCQLRCVNNRSNKASPRALDCLFRWPAQLCNHKGKRASHMEDQASASAVPPWRAALLPTLQSS